MITVYGVLPLLDLFVSSSDLRRGRALHALLLKSALTHHTLLSNRLISLYSSAAAPETTAAEAAFGDLPFKNAHSYNTLLAALARSQRTLPRALRLFDEMPVRNLVSYNTLISALSHLGHPRRALRIFAQLLKDRALGPAVAVDRFTVVGAAAACASLGALQPLRQLHGAAVVSGLEMNLIMCNAVVDSYGKCNSPDDARRVFDHMTVRDSVSWTSLIAAYAWARRLEDAVRVFDRIPERDVVSWTALISGHEQNGEEEAALELFEKMLGEGAEPTPFTLVSALGACAMSGLIARGKQMHGFVLRRFVNSEQFNIFIHNALIDMYAKCGNMASAVGLFDEMPEKDFVSWNSMVTGFANNGYGMQSLAMFERMLGAGVAPTHVTFLGALAACSHTGLVSEGRRALDLMEKYGLQPRPEHFAAFIDTLGRNCQLEEATKFIESLPSRSGLGTAGTWGALLGACRVHGNVELAERAADHLIQLEPENGARYVMLSNIYAAAGHWDDARRVRALMKGKGLKKDQACSWIEVRSVKHVFVASDKSHCEGEEIYGMIELLVDEMKKRVRDCVQYEFVACEN
ncbi:Pentatricopeptide repeat-containing protein [Ananas comosus]|uniref:Pentatricopeptide repeat-containing protein n=1 Tax=Ananas comosus TaxID=4615 RepID=A0A199UJH3_ANACO|nr:Pentatricopeptide repeat-containing protein [Ananas comosus]